MKSVKKNENAEKISVFIWSYCFFHLIFVETMSQYDQKQR